MRFAFIWCTVGIVILSFTKVLSLESVSVSVEILGGSVGDEIWAGVVIEDDGPDATEWIRVTTAEFSIEIPNSQSQKTLVLLKKNAVPLIRPLTPELIANGVSVEFATGGTIIGSVVTQSDETPVFEGQTSISFDSQLEIPVPKEVQVFSWELAENGTIEILGLPSGEHTVTVLAPGYMPAVQSVRVITDDQPIERRIFLAKAEFVRGRILSRGNVALRGEIDVLVSPAESQTAEINTHFEKDNSFLLGPFAADANVELVAKLPDGRRSRLVKVAVPAEDVNLHVHRWVQISGTVQNRETGEPITEYTLKVTLNRGASIDVSDVDGKFDEEFIDDLGNMTIEAPDHVYWVSEVLRLRGKKEFDFGTIELDQAHSIRGRVSDGTTGEPIEGATVFKFNSQHEPRYINRWNYENIRTKTNADGAFELYGFPAKNGRVEVLANGYEPVGKTIEDVNIPIELVTKPVGTIVGQVVSQNNEPVSAMIHFVGGASSTEEDGHFRFDVVEGIFRFYADADFGRSNVAEVTVNSGEKVEGIRLVIDVVGRVHGSIAGLLEDETAQVGVAGREKVALTNGLYEITGVPEGEHVIRIRTTRGRELEDSITMDETSETRFDFDLTGNASLSGRVFAGVRGLEGYEVLARSKDPSFPSARTETSRDGSYQFEGLAIGVYDVVVPGRAFVQEVEVQSTTSLDVTVGINSLSGKVLAASSVQNARVRLSGGPSEQKLEYGIVDTVDASGTFRFDGLPSGTYTVQVTHPDYAENSQEVHLEYEIVEFEIYLEESTPTD